MRVLRQVPTGRLVVLGEPGSGKTVLLIRLLLELLGERRAGTAVPVIVPLASWDPSERSLRSWLISRLILDYPTLKNLWKSNTRSCSLAEALLDRHLLLIILDGLDEIPRQVRRSAISKINKFLTAGAGVVLSSRTGEYREALHASGTPGRPMKLNGSYGISLCALSDNAIKGYLLGDTDERSEVGKRWEPVFRALTTSSPVAQALRTPLVVGLARAVYDPHDVDELEEPESLPAPEELCDTNRFPNPSDIESYLFKAFIRVTYEPRDDRKKNRWNTKEAQQWLTFLARHLQAKGQDYNILAWWELRDAAPGWLVPGVVGIICGLASGLAAGFGAHVGFGIGVGLGVGAFAGVAVGGLIRRASKNKGRPSVGIAGALAGAITGGFLGAVAGKLGIGHAVWPFGGLAVALAIGIGVGSSTNFLGGLAGGLSGGFVAALLEGIGKGLPAGLVNGVGMGLCAALAAKFVGRRAPAFRLRWSPLGAVCGFAIGIAVGLITARVEGVRIGLLSGVAIGFLSALPCGLTGIIRQDKDKSKVLSPQQALVHDYRIFWLTAPPAGIAAAIAGLLAGGLVSVYAVKVHPDLSNLISDGLAIGLAAGIIIGLGFGMHHAASTFFVIARYWLAFRRQLPWQLMRFLADAHKERGILRQSGSVYQFRHLQLMRWLAASDVDSAVQGQDRDPSPAQSLGV
jgi:hypothetical protein